MMVKVTLEAIMTLPEGTVLPPEVGSRMFTLPSGDWVKPWLVLELNDLNDLTYTQAEERGIDLTEGRCTIEVMEGASQ